MIRRFVLVAAFAAPAALVWPAEAAPRSDRRPPTARRSGLIQRAVADRLSIGVRESRWWLSDSRRYGGNGLDNENRSINFLGTLWGLDARQRFVPMPFIEYRVVSALGAGLAYDEARIRTLDWADEAHSTTAGDGDLRVRGLQAYVFARLPNRTRFTPAVRAGYARYTSAFFESGGWAAPGRSFEVGGTHGWFGAVALQRALSKRVGLEASLEHQWLGDVAVTAHYLDGSRRRGAFPVRGNVVRIGGAYRF